MNVNQHSFWYYMYNVDYTQCLHDDTQHGTRI